jgi:diacylglycerol kinase family enzyme
VHLPKVTCSQARVVDLWWDEPTDLMIDGEIVRDLPVKLEVLPGAIEICA